MKTNTKKLVNLSAILLASHVLFSGASVYATHTISVTTAGPQTINVRGDYDGSTVSSDSVNVSTTCHSGYNFVISTSVNDNNLYLDGDAANNTSGTYFAPADGQTALSSTTNSWGYYYDESTVPTASNVFSAVPSLNSSAATIKSPLTTPSQTDISDNFKIYYGVSWSSSLAAGSYRMIPDTNNNNRDGAIVYQATIADACIRYTVEFNPTDTSSGSAVTGTGTMSNQYIYEGVATNLNANTFTPPSGFSFIGWNTAQDGSGTMYTDGASVTDLTTAEGTITLYAMWSDCPNGICYYANGENVEGTMGKQSVAADTAVPLFASNFSRSGYGFAGWSDVPDYETNPSAHFYGPMEDYIVPMSAMARGVKLYAVWIESAGDLQDTNKVAELCGTGANALQAAPTNGTANLSSVSALTDQRDGQTYAIAKLADNNCWMIENLRLADTHQEGVNTVPTTLTTLNTNNPLNNGDLTNPTVTLKHNYTNTETYNTLSATSSVAYDEATAPEGWCNTNSVACDDQSRIRTDNTASRATYTVGQTMGSNANLYSYGNYYNWYSTTAGRGTYAFSTNNDSTTGDLCPTNWRLPKGGSKTRIESNDNDFWNLVVDTLNGGTEPANYASSANPYYTEAEEAGPVDTLIRTWPNNFVHSGYVSGASLSSRGSGGTYWSSTAGSASYAYNLGFNSTLVRPGAYSDNKYYGRTIRCMIPSGS